MSDLDYEALGFKAGLEIHQQLEGTKLFCDCPTVIREDSPDFSVTRTLRASVGESGTVDVAAAHEQRKQKHYEYQGYQDTTCLVELDEEPVSHPRQQAVQTAVMVAKMLGMQPVDVVHAMRKVVVDGSNTSGFQRTMCISFDGSVPTSEPTVRLDRLCLEEDSCRIIERTASKDIYTLSRLGIPLLEITTKPDIISPQHLQDTAAAIGMVLRSTGRVKRGLGTIRQDVNVSIRDGARVEIKGVQALDMIPLLAENEVRRQLALNELSHEDLAIDPAAINSQDVTDELAPSKGWLRNALEEHVAIAAKLPGLQGLLGRELFTGYRLGTELAGYAKSFGFGGIIHDAEDPAKYGLDDWKDVRNALGCSDSDGFVLAVGDAIRTTALVSSLLPQRLSALLAGVRSEVRKAEADGTTTYLRPMPGAARMYPETDVRMFRIDDLDVQIPELLSERIPRIAQEQGISESDAKQLIETGRLSLFEEHQGSVGAKTAVDVLLVREKDLRKRRGVAVDIDAIAPDILARLADGSINAGAVDDILLAFAEDGKVDWDAFKPVDEDAIRKTIQDVVASDPKAPFGALMGQAMGRLGGAADGKTVSRILKEELGE